MKNICFLIVLLFCSTQLDAQIDFTKLQKEFVSRKPALDSMYARPDVPYTSLRLVNAQGISIACWWMPQQPGKGTILLVHGFAMNKSMMLPRAKLYYDLGYNVLLMDLRARGESGGDSTTSGPEIRSDVLAVIDYYAGHLKQYGPLILTGYSHGGRAIVFAAEERSDQVKAIILESIPYSLAEGFKRMYKVDPPPFFEGDIDKAFMAIARLPVLLLVGDKDNAIIAAEAQKISATFRNEKSKLVLFEGAGHNLSGEKYRMLYMDAIKEFMDKIKIAD